MKQSVKAECSSCGASGIYHGFAEPKETGVVCLNCDGTGAREIEYVPFTTRRVRYDINKVSQSRGSLLVTGVGPVGNTITYDEFLSGKRP